MPPETDIYVDALVSFKTIDDKNVLRALNERWALPPSTKPSRNHHQIQPKNFYESCVFPLLKDPRDLPVVNVALLATVTILPSALNLLFGYAAWPLALLHVGLLVMQLEPYVLALHVTSHRPAFKARLLNYWISGLLAPFMGQTWGTYYWHHVKMHHITDNGSDDLSTTLFYQRDSLAGFFHYFFRFYFFIWFELACYYYRISRPLISLCVVLGEASLLGLCVGYLTVYSSPSILGLVAAIAVPFNLVRFGMMQGNWVQHSFLERTDPLGGGMQNSITVISSPYNESCFNDGYHASHHVNSLRHWTEHPAALVRERQRYHDEGAIVFQNTSYAEVWMFLMRKDYTALARKWVHMGTELERPKSLKEIEDKLREKTRRFRDMAEIEKIYENQKKPAASYGEMNRSNEKSRKETD